MKIDVELNPWQTPNFVTAKMKPRPRQEGFHPEKCPSWPLRDVDPGTLSEMCDAFRAEVFAKAGKKDPKR